MNGDDVIGTLLDDATQVAVANQQDQIPAQQVQATSSVKAPGTTVAGIPTWVAYAGGAVLFALLAVVAVKVVKG